MQTRTLGRNGPQVSALGFGCMGISFGLGPALTREQGIAIIRAAIADELREIDRAAAAIEVRGARYPEHLQKMVGR